MSSFNEEYLKLRKKRLEEQARQGATYSNQQSNGSRPVMLNTLTPQANSDIAPVKQTEQEQQMASNDDRKWFQKGAFEDGYQFGDLTKTIFSSSKDLETNVLGGILGIGEKVVDAGAYIVGGVGGLFSKDFKDNVGSFIEKDLYDEEAVARKIVGARTPMSWFDKDIMDEGNSILGEKTDALAQSGGQLLGTMALQSVGVPWYLTSGVTSFGSEAENAFNKGATYGQAGLSAAINAGAEILSEKLFGGSGLGEKGLINVDKFTKGISNKVVKMVADVGIDVAGEGAEEVLSSVFGAVGQKLSYASEQEWNELLSREDLFEAFVGGAVLSGVANVGKIANSAKTGRDYRTGLTENEQKVFDNVYNKRVAEAQEGGKELSKKEKAKLYDEVMKDLEKGYIGTDTIEEVLGGETYKSYQSIIEQETPLREEIDNIKNNETLTDEQKATLVKSAEEKLQKLATDTNKEQIREQLESETRKQLLHWKGTNLQTDDYLFESYDEKARRGQAFEADLSQYDEKQQDHVKRALESGVLNNTNRTREIVGLTAKMEADKDVRINYVDNDIMKDMGVYIEGVDNNGFVKDGVLYINVDSPKYLNFTVGHEITHTMEQHKELYAEMQKALFDVAKSKGEYDSRLKSVTETYKKYDPTADPTKELTADLVGDYIFTDEDFVRRLSTEHRNVFQKIWDEIKHLYKWATAGSKEARELEKAMHLFEKVYRESGKTSGKTSEGTKYSISDSKGRELSAEQREFFKDTKIKDKNGNLLVMYHGTQKGGFTVFQNKRNPNTEGFYFTNDKSYSDVFEGKADNGKYYDIVQEGIDKGYFAPETYEVYLDVKNPFVLTADQQDIIEDIGYWEYIYKPIKNAGYDGVMMEDMSQVFVFNSNQIKRVDNTNPTANADIRYSLSDSDGKQLSKGQQEYFKDSKMRDENGNLKVMYHGSQDAGFHVFDPAHSDDETSLFFVDRNDVAASYSGTYETYEAKTIRSAKDMNNFLAEIGYDHYEAVEKNGKFELLENNEHVAYSNTAQGLYEEFCWYEGVGEGDANYKVYLNLTNPLVVDAEGRNWNNITREYSQEVADRYNSLTAEEKAALSNLAEWGEYSIFKDEMLDARAAAEQGVSSGYGDVAFTKTLARAYQKLGGANANLYDAFSIASDNFSAESIQEFAVKQMNTRDYAQKAKAEGYDGVIFNNLVDVGGYGNGSEGASTVAIAFDSNQIKSVANEQPGKNADIRYSLSSDSEGRKLSDEQKKYFNGSKVVDANGNLKVMYHGTPNGDFSVFKDGTYFTEHKWYADRYQNPGASSISTGKVATNPKTFEVYLDIKKPFDINDAEAREIYINDYIKGGNAVGIDPYLSDAEYRKIDTIDWTEGEDLREFLIDNGYDYDGLVLDEGAVGGYGEDVTYRGKSYVVFNPEQVKNVDNLNPTSAPDIRYSLTEYTAEEKKSHNDAVLEHFGKTYKWAETGYLLLDGSKLDLSGKHDGAPGGYRTVDHRDITEALGYDYGGGDYSGSLVQFMSEGNIRIVPEMNGINLSVKPTKAQEQALSDYISRARGEVVLDIDDLNGYTVVSVEYPRGTYYTKVLNDIREWFDNGKQPETSGLSAFRSLTKKGAPQKRYGNYHIYGKDVRYEAPMQEQVAPTKETVSKTETVENYAPMPSEPTAYDLRQEQERLIEEAKKATDAETAQRLYARYNELEQRAAQLEAEEAETQSESLAHLDDADAPPEMEAPYYGETQDAAPIDPFEDRDMKEVSRDRKTPAYMYENPEVKPFFQAEANILLGELERVEKPETIYNGWAKYEMSYEFAQDIPEVYRTERIASDTIVYLRDTIGMSYADIEKGLKAIIEDHGAENIAAAKKLEFVINDRLLYGYNDDGGFEIPANQDYINLLTEKEIREYSEEARKQFFDVADAYDPMADIAPVAATTEETSDVPVKEQYEAIKPERKKSTEPRLKRVKDSETSADGKQRKWIGTSTDSEAVDGKVTPDDIPDDMRYYQPIPNKVTLGNANTRLDSMGYDYALSYFNSQFANKRVSLDDIALGERLIQEAVKRGDTKTASELIQNVSILGTELGQKVQALSIIKRLSPEGQLRMLQKTVERGKTRGDKSFEGVEITQEMIDHILKTYGKDGTYDQTKLNEAVEDVKKQIADQMKVTKLEKVNAWRYLSMLGNPKTHIRNLVSNVAMQGTVAVKNALARTIETVAPIENRTKTWKRASDAVKTFSQKTAMEMKDVLSDGGKYSEEASIKANRDTFKNKVLNKVYNFNSDMLSKEDWWFSKPAFTNALSEYLTANGIVTEQDIANNPKIVAKAKQYATEQSQIATFRQYSWLANKINDIEKRNTVTNIAVGAVLPFKKTPINIAKTGLNYSPLGFAKTLTYDVAQVKNGNMEASELVDHLSQNITGSALTLIGYMLASSGFLNGAGEDDKEGKYDYQLGEQAYSINIGDATFSLSWLSPIAMPLFVGANAYEQLVEGKEWNGDVVVQTLAQTLDPLSEMSFLSSLDSVLSSYDSGIMKFAGIAQTAAQSYTSQFVPTLSSQVAAVRDDTKRTTKVAGDSTFKAFDEIINNLKYKIPGLRETLEPTTDIWGNEVKQTEDMLTRAFETFIAPYSKREDIATEIDSEIKSLYSMTGDDGLIPSIPNNYVNYKNEKYKMSAKEYTAYKAAYGQTAYNLLGELFDTETYQYASDEDKAEMVNKVYDYARDVAKQEFLAKKGVTYTNAKEDGEAIYREDSIKGAIEHDMMLDEYSFYRKYPERYALAKSVGGYDKYKTYASDLYDIKADKDASGKSITGSRKEKVADYINNLDISYEEKIILFKSEYKADDTYNAAIVQYLNNRNDISYDEMVAILRELGFTVKGNTVTWD